jgi:hypothetical protein
MGTDATRRELLNELKQLNRTLAAQRSVGHILYTGIIYGVGFFIGSAIIATIALGVFGPVVGEIDWVASMYARGVQLQDAE